MVSSFSLGLAGAGRFARGLVSVLRRGDAGLPLSWCFVGLWWDHRGGGLWWTLRLSVERPWMDGKSREGHALLGRLISLPVLCRPWSRARSDDMKYLGR